MSTDDLETAYREGAIMLTDQGENMFIGSLSWLKMRIQEARDFVDKHGYQQNLIRLQTEPKYLQSETFRSRYINFCKDQAETFDTNFLYSYHIQHSDARYSGKWGLGVGLRDVYWLNILGRPFISIIGAKRLLGCPVFLAESLSENQVFLQVTDELLNLSQPALISKLVEVRAHIGEAYFAKIDQEQHLNDVPTNIHLLSLSGVFRLIRMLRGFKREFQNDAVKADICPNFDWHEIWVG